MSDLPQAPAVPAAPVTPARWKRPAFVILVAAALLMVILAWFQTPVVQVASDSTESGYSTIRCANAGPSRWEPPTVRRGQEFTPSLESTNLQILKNDIESLRVDLACDQARDRHTNTLIVTTFAAGVILFFGYVTLGSRSTLGGLREPVGQQVTGGVEPGREPNV